MHSRLAGSRGDGVEEELKQRAGEGPVRSDGDDAAPAIHIGRTQSRPNGGVRTLSSRPREEPEEGCGLGTPAATNLESDAWSRCKSRMAASSAHSLRAGLLPSQYGFSTRAGSEALPRVLRAAAEVDARATIISVDAVGAFDHASPQAMLSSSQRSPGPPGAVPAPPFCPPGQWHSQLLRLS